jgi:hypothetical protein
MIDSQMINIATDKKTDLKKQFPPTETKNKTCLFEQIVQINIIFGQKNQPYFLPGDFLKSS